MSESPQGEIRFRVPTPKDAEAITDVLNATSVSEIGVPDSSADEIRRRWRDPGVDVATGVWVAETADGRIVGYMEVEVPPASTTVNLDGYVHPDFAGRGIGTRLLALGERRAAEVAAPARADTAITVTHGAWHETSAARLLEARGYRPIRHFWRMAIDMDGPPPAPRWPDGVEVAGLRRGLDEPLFHRAVDEAFVDHWRPRSVDLAEWVRHSIEDEPNFDGSLWFRAMDGEEVAGAVIGLARSDEDPKAGWVGDLAVRRPWRRRGLARALLRHVFGAYYRRGPRRVMLAVDSESPTRAMRLYESAGMDVVRQIDVYAKEIGP